MIRNIVLISCFVMSVSLFNGCTPAKSKGGSSAVGNIYHYNITIAPDLSNRISQNTHPKPLDDIEIIDTLLNLIPDILHFGQRQTGQNDSYTFAFVNKGLIKKYDVNQDNLCIDFSKFENQRQRIEFVTNNKEYTNTGLDNAIKLFKEEVSSIYENAVSDPFGADIWSYLQRDIDQFTVKAAEEPFEFNHEFFQNTYVNTLILFTDGYIECGLPINSTAKYSKNQSYDLGKQRIDRFRNAFRKSGMGDMKRFFHENDYGIIPLTNQYLKNLNILVIEMYDRSLTESGNAKIHPTDAEIMELFWTDWFEKSNVKYFEFHQTFPDMRKAEGTIVSFLEKCKN